MVPSDWYSCKFGSHCDGIVNFRDLVQLARDLVELPRTKLKAMSERSHDMHHAGCTLGHGRVSGRSNQVPLW
jgi:hypothetical protein